MDKPIDWYFDFVSPFAYLQCERMPEALRVRPKPVLFAAFLDHLGQKGPAEIASKRTFTYRHVHWLAQREGIAFRFPPLHPFNPLRALRLAVALGCEFKSIREIYRYIWRDGNEVGSEAGWQGLVRHLGIADGDTLIGDPEVKAQLRRNGEEALAAGVFGVPTLVVDGRLFWGFDATAMALDYLRDPAWFESPEMKRLDALPVGASRSA